MPTLTSSTREAGLNRPSMYLSTHHYFPGQIVWRWSLQRSQQASLARCVSHSGLLLLVPETQPASRFTSKGGGTSRMLINLFLDVHEIFVMCHNFLWYDRISNDGSEVDRMDDDYDDFFRQDISEGKDDDEDKDIPSVSPVLTNTDILATSLIQIWGVFVWSRQILNISQLWELSASELDTARPEWQPGQVTSFNFPIKSSTLLLQSNANAWELS